MNVTSSPPPCRRPLRSAAASDAPSSSSTSARRLVALWLRSPFGRDARRSCPPARTASRACPARARSTAAGTAGAARRHARISAIASGDFFARMPTGRPEGSWSSPAPELVGELAELAVARSPRRPRSAPAPAAAPARDPRSAPRATCGGRAHPVACVAVACSATRSRSNASIQPWMLSACSRPVPIRSPLKPCVTSSAATFGSVIALALAGHRRPGAISGVEQQRLRSTSPAPRSCVRMSLLLIATTHCSAWLDAVELLVVGDLDERGQSVRERRLDQLPEGRLRQDSRGQQDGGGADLLRPDQLLLAGDEVLLEQRQVGQRRRRRSASAPSRRTTGR